MAEAQVRYRASEKGKATSARYRASEQAHRDAAERQARYRRSARGKAVRLAFEASGKGAEARRRWNERNVEQVKAWRAKYSEGYVRSPAGVVARARAAEVRSGKIAAVREMVDDIKVLLGCADCGYSEHPRALDFDHVGSDKVENVSKMIVTNVPLELIFDEIDKCDVVCANCHRIRTAIRNDYRKRNR